MKKILLYVILLIVLVSIICVIYFGQNKTEVKSEEILYTYSVNQAGSMRDENLISEENFDEYGNLTHYKYKQKQEDGTFKEKEYNIKYSFDNQKRIIKVEYDDNYIEIKYNSNNQISKLKNKNVDKFNIEYEYNFSYNNDKTKVNAIKKHVDDNYSIQEEYLLEDLIIDKEKYTVCTVKENNKEKQKFLYKNIEKEIKSNNVFSLLNLEFEGYVNFDSKFVHDDFVVESPIFNSENIIYQKNLLANANTAPTSYCYYKSDGNILKYVTYTNNKSFDNQIFYMYETINNKTYYSYVLMMFNDSSENKYTYIKHKNYLNDNGSLYKKEILENKNLAEDDYKEKLTKFEKYFEENKVNENLYN